MGDAVLGYSVPRIAFLFLPHSVNSSCSDGNLWRHTKTIYRHPDGDYLLLWPYALVGMLLTEEKLLGVKRGKREKEA